MTSVHSRLIAAGVALGVAVGLLAGCDADGASGKDGSSPAARYGTLPTYLPKTTDSPDAQLTGSPGRPAFTSQGDEVLAKYGTGAVHITVTGPDVPGEGLPYVTPATTCTWKVVMTGATVPVAIRPADFLAVDEDGHAYDPRFVSYEKKPPSVLRPGRSATFHLRVVMNTGEGVMRWQPRGHLLGLWDFVVEND